MKSSQPFTANLTLAALLSMRLPSLKTNIFRRPGATIFGGMKFASSTRIRLTAPLTALGRPAICISENFGAATPENVLVEVDQKGEKSQNRVELAASYPTHIEPEPWIDSGATLITQYQINKDLKRTKYLQLFNPTNSPKIA